MFEEIKEMNDLIIEKQQNIDELRARLTSMSIKLGERVQTSPHDVMSDIMCRIIILENEIDEMVDAYSDMKEQAKVKIFAIDDERTQNILYLRYINFKTYKEISHITGLRNGTVRTIAHRGIKKLKSIVDETQ